MFGLIAMALILIWLLASIALARWIGRWVPREGVRFLVTVVLVPTLFVLPLADEILGKPQFDRLCEEAKEIKVHGTIPMGKELYLPGGKWRRSDRDIPLLEAQRIDGLMEGLVRDEHGKSTVVPGWIPMFAYETKIFDRRDGRLLASYKHFSTPGGWIGQRLEKPLIVKDQCFPENFGTTTLNKAIFPFESNKGQ
jgi:hypothetical protein